MSVGGTGPSASDAQIRRALIERIVTMAAPPVAERIVDEAVRSASGAAIPEGGAGLALFIEGPLRDEAERVLGIDAAEALLDDLSQLVHMHAGPPNVVSAELSREDARAFDEHDEHDGPDDDEPDGTGTTVVSVPPEPQPGAAVAVAAAIAPALEEEEDDDGPEISMDGDASEEFDLDSQRPGPPDEPSTLFAEPNEPPHAESFEAPVPESFDAPLAESIDAPLAESFDAPVADAPLPPVVVAPKLAPSVVIMAPMRIIGVAAVAPTPAPAQPVIAALAVGPAAEVAEAVVEALEPVHALEPVVAPLALDDEEDELDMDDAEIEDAAPAPLPRTSLPHAAPPPAPPPAPRPPVPAPPPLDRDRPAKFGNWFDTLFDADYLRTVRPPSERATERQADFIERSLAVPPGGRILDVGSGLGHQANALARRGYHVFGIDRSPTMVGRASVDASEENTGAVFFQGDMREMTFDVEFDAVLCWGTSFGFFDDATNRLVLSRMRDALREGGRLLLDVVNRDFVILAQPNLVWFEGESCVCMEETQFDAVRSTLEVTRNVMMNEGTQLAANYAIRLYSLHELQRELESFGFRVLSVSGMTATPGVFFDADSPRILIVAERRLVSGVAANARARASMPPTP